MKMILASASPRRKQLLEMLGVELEILPAKGEETLPDGTPAEEAVRLLSRQKAEEIAAGRGDAAPVVGADTVVELGGRILGKPASDREAFAMLRALSGRTHRVYTGVTVLYRGQSLSETECTKVRFRDLSDDEIRRYIATGEPMDKAGAYGAQGLGSLFVEGLEGDFFNVMGLPLCRLGQMLDKLGVNLL